MLKLVEGLKILFFIFTAIVSFLKIFLSLFYNSCFLITCAITFGFYFYVALKQKKLYGGLIEKPLPNFSKSFVIGLFFSSFLSFMFSFWYFPILQKETFSIVGATLFLSLINLRFLDVTYTIPLFTVINYFFKNNISVKYFFAKYLDFGFLNLNIFEINYNIWLLFALAIFLLKSFLIRFDFKSGNLPIVLKDKDKDYNGFSTTKLWPFPLLILTPEGLTFVPLISSFSYVIVSLPIERQRRLFSTLHLFIGILLFLLYFVVFNRDVLITSLLLLFSNGLILFLIFFFKNFKKPLYVSYSKGLKVLATLYNSPARVMGIKTGYIIERVNGVRIYDLFELEKVVKDAAFCKIEVLDENLNRHIMQKALYENDPANLGIIGAISHYKNYRFKNDINSGKVILTDGIEEDNLQKV